MTLWCVVCTDPFDVDESVRADRDTPICSDDCSETWERLMRAESDHSSAGDPAPLF